MLRAVAMQRAKCIAFTMGLEERLGAGSRVRELEPEIVRTILDFGFPLSARTILEMEPDWTLLEMEPDFERAFGSAFAATRVPRS
jgi:hypothetical protein